MDAEVQDFIDKQAEKSAAKERALTALGAAKLAELRGEDSAAHRAIHAAEGFATGNEGRLHIELQEMADAYVAAHPEFFVAFDGFATPEKQGDLVTLISVLRDQGLVEEVAKLTMFELARFERQNIGAVMRAQVRVAGGKG